MLLIVDFRLVVKCRFVVCIGWGKMIKFDRWTKRLSNQFSNGIYEIIDISIMNRGTSQGKSSVFNESLSLCVR